MSFKKEQKPAGDTLPEMRLLLGCARGDADPGRLDEAIAGIRDWEAVLQAASFHRMVPLLYWRLRDACPGTVPANVTERLRSRFEENARRNLFWVRELRGLLDLLAGGGVAAIPYKGPLLAEMIYGNLALRDFVDLDILVHERDFPAAREFLRRHGFHSAVDIPPGYERAHLKYKGEEIFVRHDKVVVELQASPLPWYFALPLDPERLWDELQPVRFAGKDVQTLSPEVLLLILCVHGAKHGWYRLDWLCDLAGLLRAYPRMEGPRILARAEAWGAGRMLRLGLCLVQQLLGSELPPSLRESVAADRSLAALRADVERRLLHEPPKPITTLASLRFQVRALEGVLPKARCLARTVLMPTTQDWKAVRLPPAFAALYYVIRPFRLLREMAGGRIDHPI
ncbi:MAG: nucleotidyltransferase family protein [Verrucomicrobia bacterium]|nr:nucleotidyltransferase family protein [Verrucomicrobiota bacterium]